MLPSDCHLAYLWGQQPSDTSYGYSWSLLTNTRDIHENPHLYMYKSMNPDP